jgi:hypothetical protein
MFKAQMAGFRRDKVANVFAHPKTSCFVSLKGQCHEVFCFWFFCYESVTPQPQSIPLGPFQIFSKIRGDIRSSRLTTGVADTGGK